MTAKAPKPCNIAELCANCGNVYQEHLLHDGNKCHVGSVNGWFPKSVADAINDAKAPDARKIDLEVRRIAEKAFGARPNQGACIAAINEATAALRSEIEQLRQQLTDRPLTIAAIEKIVTNCGKEKSRAEAAEQQLAAWNSALENLGFEVSPEAAQDHIMNAANIVGELRQQLAEAEERFREYSIAAGEQYTKLERRVRELSEALQKYGAHKPMCMLSTTKEGNFYFSKCTCGLTEIAKVEQKKEK